VKESEKTKEDNPMPLIRMKHFLKQAFGLFGLDVRHKGRRHEDAPGSFQRASMLGCLQQAKQCGLNPQTVLDIGVATGTTELYDTFPGAYHILMEPLEEFLPELKAVVNRLDKAEYILAAAHSTSGNIVINVHPDLFGSSVYKEEEDSDVNGIE